MEVVLKFSDGVLGLCSPNGGYRYNLEDIENGTIKVLGLMEDAYM